MASTKLVFLGMFIIVVGLAVNSATTYFVSVRTAGLDTAQSLAYVACSLFVIGFVVGVIGLVRR